ncbi:hypothetical protein F4776DRAFT_626031 [Hypoxylon sp. NC0597]|nr:hypothetical protein F4776DRAFT_626031 [Hypoxylon sp. NC0597]
MAHPRCLAYSPARALHRVLVSDIASVPATPSLGRHASIYYLFPPRLFFSSSSALLAPQLPSPIPIVPIAPPPASQQHVRTLTTSPALQSPEAYKKRLTNAKIPYKWVRIAAAPPDNSLSPPQRLETVLRSIDPKTHTLVMVAPPPHEPHTLETHEPHAAICRIIDNAAAATAAAEAEKQARRKAVDTKELELSWSITEHDLSHKLRRLREFLSKGLNVEITLAKKKGGRTATREEAERVVARVREEVASIDGAKESRKMDGDVGGLAKLFFEGPSEKKRRKKKQEQEQQQAQEQTQGQEGEQPATTA